VICERHERLILEEYAAAGVAPVYRSDGEIVTLGLARKLNLLNSRATGAQPERTTYDAVMATKAALAHPTDAYQGVGE
jgi:hypothetical protein